MIGYSIQKYIEEHIGKYLFGHLGRYALIELEKGVLVPSLEMYKYDLTMKASASLATFLNITCTLPQ